MVTEHGPLCPLSCSDSMRHFNFTCAGASRCADDLITCCKDGSLPNAVDALETLDRQNIPVSIELLVSLIKKCAEGRNLAIAQRLHSILSCKKCNPPTLLADNLIRMFTTCGSLADANQAFLMVPKPSIFTWTEVILAHAKLGANHTAIKLYSNMPWGAVKPDKYLLTLILQVISNMGDLECGKLVHHQMSAMKFLSDMTINNTLVCMYAKCCSLDNAQNVFNKLKNRDAVTWSAMIVGCSRCGYGALALDFFQEMEEQGVKADRVTILCVLKACSILCQGMYIHSWVVCHCSESDVAVSNALVDMYTMCGCLQEAFDVFNRVRSKDTILWSCLIAGCADLKQDDLVFELFEQMLLEGVESTEFTHSSILKTCGNARTLERGRIIHDMEVRRDFTLGVIIGNTLIDMYAQCGALEDALRVFQKLTIRSVVSWGIIINACADSGFSETALKIFDNFKEINLLPDEAIFLAVLKACGNVEDLFQGREIHSNIVKCGCTADISINNTIVDMYFKCKSMAEALHVFEALPYRTCVSWTAVLAGYNQQQQWSMALNLFAKVIVEESEPDKVIFLHALEACGNVHSMGQGMLIHDQIVRQGLESLRELGSALIDTYCRCGCWNEGYKVFNRLLSKDMVAWGAIIGGLVHGGHWSLVRTCLSEMRQQCLRPSVEMYSCILIACSSAGLVEEGQFYFDLMKEDHGNSAKVEHYSCMADLFGRVGLVRELEDFFQTMPIPPNEISWTSLLDSCKTYHNIGKVHEHRSDYSDHY